MKIKPTDSELEILNILWQKGAGTVREVHEALMHKEAGYTTTLKLMQIMLEKEMLSRDSSSKTHIYKPAITREQTQGQLLKRMIDTVFNGSAKQLVLQALGNGSSSQEELKEIKDYLAAMEKAQQTKKH